MVCEMKKISKILQNENLPLPTKSLFLEGMRQLKIGGIVYAALCVLVSLGNCADVYSHSDAMQHRYTLSVNIDERFNDNLFFLLFLAVIFLTAASFSVMTFLRSPRARDFYLATPQSSGRLWASFASAVLAWHGIAMGASFIVWLLFALPYDLKSVGVCLVILGSLLASTFLIFALVLLALSLTGRLVSALVTLSGLVLTLPAVFTVLNMGTEEYEGFYFYEGSRFYPDVISYCFNRYMLDSFYWNGTDMDLYRMLTSGGTVAFSLAAGLLLTGLAAYFAAIRTGDATGHPFVNRTAHVISLTAVNLPMACVLAALVYGLYSNDGSLRGYDAELASCALALGGTAVFFWLSELLMTFRVKHSFRAVPYIAIPLAIAAATAVGGHWHAFRDVTFTPAADEVESFTLVRNNTLVKKLAIFRLTDTYGRTVTDNWEFTDRAMIARFTEMNNERANEVKQSPFDRSNWSREDDEYASIVRIQLNLKNGRKLIRRVKLGDQDIDALQKAMLSDAAFKEKFLALPDPEKVNIDFSSGGITGSEAQDIYRSLTEEFRLLPEERKLQFISENLFQSEAWRYEYSDPETDTDYQSESAQPDSADSDGHADRYQWENTHVILQSRSADPGDYVVTSTVVDKPRKEDSTLSVHLEGYGEGALYAPDGFYCFGLNVSKELFPKTTRLIVSVCNSKIDQITRMPSHPSEMNATYFGSLCMANVDYFLLSPRNEEYQKLMLKEYLSAKDCDADAKLLRYDVDVNALVDTLLTDIKATKDIDFTKPYCKMNVYLPYYDHSTVFWAQTENPVDALLTGDAQAEEAAANSDGKNK